MVNMKATFKAFKTPSQLVEFINKANIKKEDIISISTGRNFITIYYFV